ncbi:hypothetical protein [Salinicola socius]|uniref:DUF1439 domain-containing protein n=1 Tax=Salinicola socius TaxID=404433 RepID=A0A1Q8STR4_9GAMM|nr:hypothetical protein [Salinicola socius]OLO04796.1 hypothetical protein BTW07_08385 [Salinicola socius]
MPSRYRPFIALASVALLGGCLALPQVSFMLGRIALSSMGVENVRIGNYHFSPGLQGIDELSLLSSGLALAGLPVNIDLPLAMTLPAGAPPIELQGFDWQLQVPGAEPTAGEIDETIRLQGGEPATVTLPVALEPTGIDALSSKAERVSSLLSLARQLSRSGELPAGSQLSLTPTLPAALDGIVTAPTLTLDVGEPATISPDNPQESAPENTAEDARDKPSG